MSDAMRALDRIWRAALAAADPYPSTLSALPDHPGGVLVVGAGKAAGRMAKAAEAAYGSRCRGAVTTPPGYAATLSRITSRLGGHPTPSASGASAAEEALALVAAMREGERLVVLLSGGASALWTLPCSGVSLESLQALNKALLRSGAAIHEINTVRKHLSRISGGRLAAARPRGVDCTALIVSDVPGDDPSAIGSGPTAGDPTSLVETRNVLARHAIQVAPEIVEALGLATSESVKPGDPALAGVINRVILTARSVQDAAQRAAEAEGYYVVRLGDHLEGDAGEIARMHAQSARQHGRRRALISGGEFTVTGASGAEGGRCREYALALAVALDGARGVCAAALDTDGVDGVGGAAGAVIGPDTLDRARALGMDAVAMLQWHDSGAFFHRLGDAIITGPTLTNVSDLRIILVEEGA